jgi:antitoxin MazE
MHSQIGKWGNSLALRIPSAIARQIELREGGEVDISVREGALVVAPVKRAVRYDLDELLEGMTDENRHAEIAFGEPVGKEVW